MIGLIAGEVVFSDGIETIVHTPSGVGYQIFFSKILAEGSLATLFISHIQREDSQDLYGFESLRSKKMFELLTSVKGVGPKSAFALISSLGATQIIDAVNHEDKKVLTKAPGIGAKAASQIILDLSGKIQKILMYSNSKKTANTIMHSPTTINFEIVPEEKQKDLFQEESESDAGQNEIMNDALLACKELGFKEDKVLTIAKKLLQEHSINRAEQLVHLVLKEI